MTVINLSKIFIFSQLLLIVGYFVEDSNGLECLNCFSRSRDLSDCEPMELEDLHKKLKENEKYRRFPSIRISKDPDACVLVDAEFENVKEGKVIEVVVVRTQIRQRDNRLFEDQKLTKNCKIKTAVESGTESSFTTKYCACTSDFCNGQSKLGSLGFWSVLIGLVVVATSGFQQTIFDV